MRYVVTTCEATFGDGVDQATVAIEVAPDGELRRVTFAVKGSTPGEYDAIDILRVAEAIRVLMRRALPLSHPMRFARVCADHGLYDSVHASCPECTPEAGGQ